MARKFKVKITEASMMDEDRSLIMNGYLLLEELRSVFKKAKEPALKDILSKEITSLRNNLVGKYSHKFYQLSIKLGPHEHKQVFGYYPGTEVLVACKNELVQKLSKGRAERKQIKKVTREFNGVRYNMVGNDNESFLYNVNLTRDDRTTAAFYVDEQPKEVKLKKKTDSKIMEKMVGGGRVFEKGGSILALLESKEYADRIYRPKVPYDKSNYVGVEIELLCDIDRDKLNAVFIKHKLAGKVYVKHDGSINPEKAGEYPHEITIISKQSDYKETVKRVCDVLNSKEVNAYVNNSCGLHVHMDMRNRDPKICYKNLYKCLPVIYAMVPKNRTTGAHAERYCRMNTNPEFDMNSDRYQALNAYAYRSHKTLELRVHSGSTNANKINNLIEMLAAIVDATEVKSTSAHLETAEDIKLCFGISNELVSYINNRIEKFKNTRIDTRVDHFEAAI